MSILKTNRRTFLRGAGGAMLSLPLLSSLTPRIARSQDDVPVRLVVFVSKNGVYAKNWHNTSLSPDQRLEEHAHTMPLSDFGEMAINPTLGNEHRHLYPKLNLIRGLDIVTSALHQTPGPLSASCSNSASSVHGSGERIRSHPTTSHSMDTLLDERIYESEPTMRAIRVSPFLSLGGSGGRWAMVSHRNGDGIASETSLSSLYDQLFGNLSHDLPDRSAQQAGQLGALDSALPEIQRLSRSPHISAADRRTLDSYFGRMSELRSNMANRRAIACMAPPSPTSERDSYDTPLGFYQQTNDMITAAFACDLTRIAILNVQHGNENVRTDNLHGNSHHEFRSPSPGHDATDLNYYRTQASFYFDLVNKMDAIVEPNGETMLDNSVVLWVNTLGVGDYHRNNNIPVLMAGSAGGRIRTGQFLDYERRPSQLEANNNRWRNIGRPYHNLLTDIMRCHGLTPRDWELSGAGRGFGDYSRAEGNGDGLWDRYMSDRNHSLPGLLMG